MTCAIVIWVDRPFEEVDAKLGLTKSAELRMAAADPTEDVVVLVARGFENIGADAIARLAELRYRVEDASELLAEARRRYPFANETRVWRGDSFHEMSFLRFLVLELYFGSEPVLAMDSDIVWRVDPYRLVEKWKAGGSFLCYVSTCFVFIRNTGWYDSYRAGFEQLAANPDFGAGFKKAHFTGLYHEQAMCQFLVQSGMMENDVANLTGHGFTDQYFMTVNPLGIAPEPGAPPLEFRQEENAEYVGGKKVAYWHMQQGFARYLTFVRILPELLGQPNMRVPYNPSGQAERDTLQLLLNTIHLQLSRGDLSFNHHRQRHFADLVQRERLYELFFRGSLARDTFRDQTWWKPGVWAQ